MSSNSVHACSKCSKTASLSCKGCKAMPNAIEGQISSTWYCGPECQKADWIEHKPQCKASQARQALYRAAVTAKKIFYAYQKQTFMSAPERIEKIGTIWLIHPKVCTVKSLMLPFPHDTFPDAHDQDALLTHQSCNTAVSEMHNVVKTLFAGLYTNVDEVSHFVKNARHHLKQAYPGKRALTIDGTDYAHTVIRLAMKSGEIYALDMTGAQYGWDDCIIPWKVYSDSKVRAICDVMPFGQTRVFCQTRANNMGEQRKLVHHVQQIFAKTVDEAIMWWQKREISTHILLRLPEQEFQEKQRSLVAAVGQLLQHFHAYLESEGVFDRKETLQYGVIDREFTSSALAIIPGRRPPS